MLSAYVKEVLKTWIKKCPGNNPVENFQIHRHHNDVCFPLRCSEALIWLCLQWSWEAFILQIFPGCIQCVSGYVHMISKEKFYEI